MSKKSEETSRKRSAPPDWSSSSELDGYDNTNQDQPGEDQPSKSNEEPLLVYEDASEGDLESSQINVQDEESLPWVPNSSQSRQMSDVDQESTGESLDAEVSKCASEPETEFPADPHSGSPKQSSEESEDSEDGEDGVEDNDSLDGYESAEENFVPEITEEDSPLYPGAPVTLFQALLAILTFCFVNNLSASCISDLLELISLFLLSKPTVLKSLYRFRKIFSKLKTPLQYHFYCTVCFGSLTSKNDVCENCPDAPKSGYFLTMSIVEQLKNLYSRKGFKNLLNYRDTRIKKNVSNYEDIYDGHFYKKNAAFLRGNNISFTWNTDGVSIFKSSKFKIWPFYLIINELPYRDRYKEENLILAGLWFGEKDPAANLFMSKLKPEVETLFSEGIEAISPDLQQPFNVRAMVLCGTGDLPAKATFLNMIRHNGKFPCTRCQIEGERSPRTNSCFAFPVEDDPTPRTHNDMLRYAEEASNTNNPVLGVKGPTYLRFLVADCYRSTAIDVMHCVFSGIAKKLMRLWFDPEFRDKSFTLRDFLHVVSNFIIGLTPPSYFQRLPRSLSDHFHYWKSSELKVWLLFYSLVILREVMSAEYFNHHLMFVYAIYLLSQDSVSENMIEQASVLLREYVTKFQYLYGLEYMSLNVHLLLHLPECVKDFGPLWTTSCFPFEDINGKLASHVHGTRYAHLQICSYASTLINLSSVIRSLPLESPVRSYCTNLTSSKKFRVKETIGSGFYSVGKYYKSSENPLLITESLIDIDAFGNITYLPSVLKGRILIRSHAHDRAQKTSSTCISYNCDDETKIGIVKHFVKVTQCDCPDVCACDGMYYAILSVMNHVKPFHIRYPNVQVGYVYQCTESGTTIALPVQDIGNLCILMRFTEKIYVCEPVNTTEVE